jgi:hypothetical protein
MISCQLDNINKQWLLVLLDHCKGKSDLSQSDTCCSMSTIDRPTTLAEFLTALKLDKYIGTLEEQQVDLQLFLELTDADLNQLGIKFV